MNPKWKSCLLGDILTLQRGFDITKKEQKQGSVPVISSSGINSYHDIAKVKGPGVVIGRKGSLGTVFYIEEDYWPHDTTLWIKDFHGNVPKFTYYFLSTLNLANFDVGASNPTLNRNHIHLLPIYWPPIPTQHKIASILSAYNDLIENNIRRIAILEEMAQTIYQEWFVNFRYPGHEKDTMVESELGMIPERWGKVTVGDLVKRIPNGKKYDNKTVNSFGAVPVLDQGRSGIIGYHDNEPDVQASRGNPVIVFANHTCYQRIIQFPFSTIQNVLPFTPNLEHNRNIYWLHWVTKDLVKFNDYKGHWPEFVSKNLLLPPVTLCNDFGDKIKVLVEQIYLLEKKKENLRRTREILLPKLISGEIDVESLDIDIPEVIEPEEQQDFSIGPEPEPIDATQLALPL